MAKQDNGNDFDVLYSNLPNYIIHRFTTYLRAIQMARVTNASPSERRNTASSKVKLRGQFTIISEHHHGYDDDDDYHDDYDTGLYD